LFAGQVGVPEGPGAALERADGVDGAAAVREGDRLVGAGAGGALDFFFGEEDAVVLAAGVAVFLQAELALDLAAVLLDHLLGREAEVFGEADDLVLADPDEARAAGAAVAALGAGELQPVGVPRAGRGAGL